MPIYKCYDKENPEGFPFFQSKSPFGVGGDCEAGALVLELLQEFTALLHEESDPVYGLVPAPQLVVNQIDHAHERVTLSEAEKRTSVVIKMTRVVVQQRDGQPGEIVRALASDVHRYAKLLEVLSHESQLVQPKHRVVDASAAEVVAEAVLDQFWHLALDNQTLCSQDDQERLTLRVIRPVERNEAIVKLLEGRVVLTRHDLVEGLFRRVVVPGVSWIHTSHINVLSRGRVLMYIIP